MSARYILVVFLTTFFATLSYRRTKKLKKKGREDFFFYCLTIITALLFAGLRTKYNDTTQYIYSYLYDAERLDIFLARLFAGSLSFGDNLGFWFVSSLFKTIGLNEHWFIMIFSSFHVLVYFWFIKKHSDIFPLTVFLFMLDGFSLLLAAMKQVTATAIALIALDRFISGKRARFYILVFVAMLFHPYVFIYLSVPFIYKRRPWTMTTLILLIAFMLFGAFSRNAVDVMVGVTRAMGDFGYSADYILSGKGVNIIRFLVYLSPVFLSMVYRKELYEDSDAKENLFSQLMILSMSFMFIAIFVATILVGRLPSYFTVPSKIATAWMLNKLMKRGHIVYIAVAVILFFIFFVYEEFINRNFDVRYTCISLWQLLGLTV